MITLTPTADSATDYLSSGADSERENQTGFYAGTEKVVWVDDMANLGAFADESLHYTSISGEVTLTVGGEPGVPQLEIYNRHGMLVTYYVRAKATEDALTVHYVDDTEGVEFYSYNIAVKEGTYFKSNIGLANPWKGNLANGDVQNFYGRTQYVSSDLATLSQVGAQYLYTEYECIRVERSDDGKHVSLYYTFDPTVYFVVDFSLPMEITAADLSVRMPIMSGTIGGEAQVWEPQRNANQPQGFHQSKGKHQIDRNFSNSTCLCFFVMSGSTDCNTIWKH